MFQSTIIIDPRSEIRAKQSINTFVVRPTVVKNKESVRIADIRELLAWSAKAAFDGGHRTIVIESFHKSSSEAPHTLLKLLEEPPQNLRIFLTVDQPESVLSTIRSRCVIVPSDKISDPELEDWGLTRILSKKRSSSLSWEEFYHYSAVERLQWISTFIKTKKDLGGQLVNWQNDLATSIQGSTADTRMTHIANLGVLEEGMAAIKSHVLPRLILNSIAIQISHH